jgi:hypothetical protein
VAIVGIRSRSGLFLTPSRLRPIQRFNPALFLRAERHRVFGRIEVKPYDGFRFIGKLRIVAL